MGADQIPPTPKSEQITGPSSILLSLALVNMGDMSHIHVEAVGHQPPLQTYWNHFRTLVLLVVSQAPFHLRKLYNDPPQSRRLAAFTFAKSPCWSGLACSLETLLPSLAAPHSHRGRTLFLGLWLLPSAPLWLRWLTCRSCSEPPKCSI